MKYKSLLIFGLLVLFVPLLSAQESFCWKKNLEESKVVVRAKVASVNGETVLATVTEAFAGKVKPKKNMQFTNNDNETVFKTGDEYFLFLREGVEKKSYRLPENASLPILNGNVFYNLLPEGKAYAHPSNALSEFLKVYYDGDLHLDYIDHLLDLVKIGAPLQEATENFMRLYYLNYAGFSDDYKTLLQNNEEQVSIAALYIVGNIQNDASRKILLDVLSGDFYPEMKKVAAKQIARDEAAMVLPLLSPLLQPENTAYEYEFTARCIFSAFVENEVKEIIPVMKDYLEKTDRNQNPNRTYLISTTDGLAHFASIEMNNYLHRSATEFFKSVDRDNFGIGTEDWGVAYMKVMEELPDMWNLQPYLYNFMTHFNGINSSFRNNPNMFREKKLKEDSLLTILKDVRPDFLPEGRWSVWAEINSNYDLVYYLPTYILDEEFGVELLVQILPEYMQQNYQCEVAFYSKNYYALFDSETCAGSQPLGYLINYLAKYAESKDVIFLMNLLQYGYAENDLDRDCLEKAIEKAEEAVGRVNHEIKR
ncbi:hypothetical protein LJC68_03160 [Bacteroidales bacterium OttesenSCG-928-B11]|nr:hypothetical protein [Bacteroidales bacterium OttesenSCG-928-E04]MDL2308559.1 hypothetical protein [Bacteroidales bacterium OttesenSCG-928-C03]MDL2311859.1 hypothetical protein [Bacteroidales bacterium OttesenSCG-928-B11]MDL2326525.1 hypothetical protein [Bacteroidales bacterium OttesenSCG-928-A14]